MVLDIAARRRWPPGEQQPTRIRRSASGKPGCTFGDVTTPTFDRDSWERRWAQALREHGDAVSRRPPNAHLLAEVGDLPPGRALDAGCGHGAEAIWLAAAGWRVTAVDFSVTALEHAASTARTLGVDGIEWVEGDLGTWTPRPGAFELVSCLYVHVAGSVEEMVARLGSGVAPGGTLLLVGHLLAPGQVQVTVETALAALDPDEWETRSSSTPTSSACWPRSSQRAGRTSSASLASPGRVCLARRSRASSSAADPGCPGGIRAGLSATLLDHSAMSGSAEKDMAARVPRTVIRAQSAIEFP